MAFLTRYTEDRSSPHVRSSLRDLLLRAAPPAVAVWVAAVVPAVAIALWATVFVIATAVGGRPRPHVPHLDPAPPTSNYPSGHMGAATALYLSFALLAHRVERP
ncbi:MAG: hypothetical protein ABIU87_12290 [Ornithinibacter sp.]